MSLNLIDAAKGLFTTELISQASSTLGENESGISKALSGIIPAILAGLLKKVNTNEGANSVAQMVREQQQSNILGNLGGLLSGDNSSLLSKGAGLLSGLFGNKSDLIGNLISNYAGVKSSTSNSLLSMAVPALLGLLGRHASGTDSNSITSLLNSQRDNIQSAIPAGLNLNSILGGISGAAGKFTTQTRSASGHTAESTKGKGGFVLPMLLVLAALLAAYLYFGKGCNKEAQVVADTADSVTVDIKEAVSDVKDFAAGVAGKFDSLTNEFIYNPGNSVTIQLPNNGGQLQVGEYSTENRLYRFLADPNSVIDAEKGNWFEFTNVKFKTGSSDITDESMTQLRNLVAISKAYPSAKFKIGGYTDNTGSQATNIALSQKRADAVAAMLKKLGAAASAIVEAEGYGPAWPVADNATPEGRAQNRRVAVNFKAK